MRRRLAIIAAFLVSGIPLLPHALAQTPTPATQPQPPAFEKEIALGKSLAAEAERHEKILPDTVVAEYVAHLARGVAQHASLSVPLVTRIIANKEVRSIALPSGFLYITSGLIARTDTEAELAGLLAHEIAHIARRHGMRQLSRDVNSPASTIPMIYMGSWSEIRAYRLRISANAHHTADTAQNKPSAELMSYRQKNAQRPEPFGSGLMI